MNLPLPEEILCFATDFVEWILEGKKAATTRIDNFVLEDGTVESVGHFKPGDRVKAVDTEGG